MILVYPLILVACLHAQAAITILTREGQDVMSVAGTTASDGVPTSEVVEVEPSSAAEPSRPVELINTRYIPSREIP